MVKIDIANETIRKKVIAGLPSLIGMDLLPKFKLVATDKLAYLER